MQALSPSHVGPEDITGVGAGWGQKGRLERVAGTKCDEDFLGRAVYTWVWYPPELLVSTEDHTCRT